MGAAADGLLESSFNECARCGFGRLRITIEHYAMRTHEGGSQIKKKKHIKYILFTSK